MVMQHGCARGIREKLIEFLIARHVGEPLLRGHIALTCGREETMCLYAWESTVNLRQVGQKCWTLM